MAAAHLRASSELAHEVGDEHFFPIVSHAGALEDGDGAIDGVVDDRDEILALRPATARVAALFMR
jgi:hypothetical protein